MAAIVTVKQLNTYVRSIIEGDVRLNFISVRGEISNLKKHYASGHLYFSLKDNDAVIRCVMFKQYALRCSVDLSDGQRVICSGKVSLYEKDGQYQLFVENMVSDGVGDLAEQFRVIKERLEKEGLFDISTKRSLPKFPKNIAVLTSRSGAALQDILNVISRRYPVCRVTVCPVTVQGDTAAKSIIEMLNKVYDDCFADIIILGRGGGSAEDLWAFNDEQLARKIYESPVPVISAVGHETDFTICDFVADLRAPTPSAAAELAVPDIEELKSQIFVFKNRLKRALEHKYSKAQLQLTQLSQSVYLLKPMQIIFSRQVVLEKLVMRLKSSYKTTVEQSDAKFRTSVSKLETASPLKTLARGYAVVQKNGKRVKKASDLICGDNVDIILSDGSVNAEVNDIK